MKSPDSSFTYHPFENIKDLLEARAVFLPESPPLPPTKQPDEEEAGSDQTLFALAMEDVLPISRDNCVERGVMPERPSASSRNENAEALLKLRNLIQYGEGFNVCDTPEYIEGTGYHVHREIARRLHRGDYSIQAHVDLHGLTAEAAREVFEAFLKRAVMTGKRGILVIHGRGLSSPAEPVLKKKVVEWLTRGPWRKWIIAFSSARVCDGGAGATYVLLRDHPASRRRRKRLHPASGHAAEDRR
jgi:DNA-nicking Smr family endonuclease